MVKSKGKSAVKHVDNRVYGYTRSREGFATYGIGKGGATTRRRNKPKHSGVRFFT